MFAVASTPWSLPVTHPVLTFALVMTIILVTPLAMQRLRLPGTIGMILAGVVVGPHVLGLLRRDGAIELIGTVGLLYIVLLAGLQIDLHRFRRYRSHSLAFGTISYLVPQVVGIAVALWLLGFGWAEAVLLGSMFGSHTLLTYPIASRLGIAGHRAVTTAVGGTIVTDSAALLVLAVVARTANGALDARFWITLAISLAIYVAAVWLLLPWAGRWFFRTIRAEGTSHFVFILATGYGCAFLAEVAGLQPITGAFLAGLALNRLIPDHGALMNRLQFAGSWFFIPVFLLSVGMLVDPRVFVQDAATIKVAATMAVTVIATKFLAAWIARRVLGFGRDEGWLMFGLSVNQAAATLAAVLVGVRVGIFEPNVLDGAILMILASCLIGPWVTQRFGRRLAAAELAQADDDGRSAPQRILIPLRNPQAADAIMDVALLLREKDSPEPLYPLTVVLDGDDSSAQVAAAERMLGHAVMYAAGANVPVVPTTRLDNNAAAGVLRAIRELRISTVVMGWTGSGTVRSRVFGSVLDQLLEASKEQFIVCRLRTPLNAAQRLVLAVPRFADHELGFRDALAAVRSIAQRAGLDLVVGADEAELPALRAALALIAPELPATFVGVPSLSTWRESGAALLRDEDVFILLAARPHRVSWSPAIDRLPGQVASLRPELNLLVVYPGEIGHEAGAESDAPGELRRLLRPERMILGIDAVSPIEAIDRMLATWFDGRGDLRAALSEELDRALTDSTIDLAPGIVLVHGHSAQVQQPLAFLATTKAPLRFPRVRGDADLILMLLTPLDTDPAAHLRHLATLARLLQTGDAAAQIRAAEAPEDLRGIIDSAGRA
ncbi:MAG TPA: cation:proton antiporter [Phycisphaerales bacterium]|nr:cation:proton antiporter [Phycisphaerales bacterium]HMP36126.1 cation:proton antiporter [Phycisphaerales bacterium]